MNYKMIFSTLGKLLVALSAFLMLPVIVAIIYGDSCLWAILVAAAISLALGAVLYFAFKTKNHVIYAREGIAIVALSWILFSVIGALPFYLSREIPSYVDAFFETVSGFTTTGASILNDIESMSHSLLFWRSFTHWIGGMGVLVFVMALIPNFSERSIHILRAEVPGPIVGKLVPKIKQTARILYLIYIALTVLEIILLLVGGMPLFDSIVHTFGTAGTGGFGIKADSIAGYSSYLQWVIAVFMLVFGVNFNLYYLILIRKFKMAFKSGELWCYMTIVAIAVTVVAFNISELYGTFEEIMRTSVFQVASIISTTGYATADFNLWPGLSKAVLLVLMFVGACAGSTAGGLKVSRVILLFKKAKRELLKAVHPRSVNAVRLEGKQVDEKTISAVGAYIIIYLMCFVAVFLVLSFEPFDMETNFSATAACFNNVGPGFSLVGPTANYSGYSDVSKIVLSYSMLLGRLEILPMLLLFSSRLWKKD